MGEKKKTYTIEEMVRAQGMVERELEEQENAQRQIIEEQLRRKQRLGSFGNRMMASLSRDRAIKSRNELKEADSIIRNSQKILQNIERRRHEEKRETLIADPRWTEIENMRKRWKAEFKSADFQRKQRIRRRK